MIKVLLVDDHKVVRDGLRATFLSRPDLQVVAEAGSCEAAISEVARVKPDLAFVDLKLPDGNGADLIAKLTAIAPDLKCIILTSDPNSTDLRKARSNGALGFLTKDVNPDEYLTAIEKVLSGRNHISSLFSEFLLNEPIQLTKREIEVLQGFADGLTYKEIGADLGMSPRTVETHKLHLLEKMEVKSVVEMVRKAIRDGLIQA
ncbi:MAG: response regulator transcription factor [Cyclobacteriaceae bacterium]